MADTPINPSSLVTNGATVGTTNPLPCVRMPAGTPADDATINPTTFVVNGAIVSATNPLPILLG
jgi:hypothetical protein